MPRAIVVAWLAVAGFVLVPQASQAGDAGRGADLFGRCAVCHTVEPGKHKLGPSLAGVVGRAAASAEGFRYSPAMTAHGEAGVVWASDTLDPFLADPRGVVPGTRMAFPGLKDEADRADVIEYLETLSPR
jgi:cytochrome c